MLRMPFSVLGKKAVVLRGPAYSWVRGLWLVLASLGPFRPALLKGNLRVVQILLASSQP
jgi:hypothetical protein